MDGTRGRRLHLLYPGPRQGGQLNGLAPCAAIMAGLNRRWVLYGKLLATVIVWGGSFIATKLAVREAAPPQGKKGKGGKNAAARREHWLLYTGPVEVPAGKTVYAKACRLGYRDSPTVRSP